MSKNYREEYNKIQMNDQMKKRILQNVLATNENDNSVEENIKAKTIIQKVKKYNNLKRNMQMVAACSAILICISVAKNYPMLLKNAPNDLEQKETTKSHEDENNDLKTNDDNEIVSSKDSKEISNNNQKEERALVRNDNGESYLKEKSNASSKIGQEEKDKDNLKSNSNSNAEKSQLAQNNNDKATENSNISSKTNPEEDINKKENENSTSTESKTTDEEVKENRILEDDSDNSVSSTSVVVEKSVIYNQEYKTLEEAETALNLKVNPLKILPKDLKMESISVISNEIIEIKYNDGNKKIIFRAGKDIDNISGDYNVYQARDTAKVNGINITLEGNKSKEYNLATWEKDGISYSISAENGIDEKTILGMIM